MGTINLRGAQLAAVTVNEPGDWRTLAVGQLVAAPQTGTGPAVYWSRIPGMLQSVALEQYFLTPDPLKKTAEEYGQLDFDATSDGLVWMLTTARGTQAQLENQGWRIMARDAQTEHGDEPFGQNKAFLDWILFERVCKAGERFSIRTETYQSPVVLPLAPAQPPVTEPSQPPMVNAFTLPRLAFGQIQGLRIPFAPPDRGPLRIETSVDLRTWSPLITFPTNSGPFEFIDSAAVSYSYRFYRAVKP